MKKLILSALACIAIVLSSCNQNSPAPAPAPAAPTPAPTPTTTATSSMTATEALLVGDWIFDKQESYSSGNLSATTNTSNITYANGTVFTYTVYAGAHMDLKSSLLNNTVYTPQMYNGDYYGSSSISGAWWVMTSGNGDQLTLLSGVSPCGTSGSDYIITLNATTLIYQEWIPGQIANGGKTYFHK